MRSATTNRGSAYPNAMDTKTIQMWACAHGLHKAGKHWRRKFPTGEAMGAATAPVAVPNAGDEGSEEWGL